MIKNKPKVTSIFDIEIMNENIEITEYRSPCIFTFLQSFLSLQKSHSTRDDFRNILS